MIKIIDINFLNEKAAIGCFLIKDNDDLVLIETGPSISVSYTHLTLPTK